jgi:NADH-quinone oxidoreductase B subunit
MGLVNWARRKSPWISHFCTGSCNGCDIEILSVLTPRYDIERFGAVLKGSIRHADILLITGAVTRQVRDRLIRIYEQMPEPKYVVPVGTCAISGGVYRGSYNVYPGVDSIIPCAAYVSGCPVKPENIINGLSILLKKIGESHGS